MNDLPSKIENDLRLPQCSLAKRPNSPRNLNRALWTVTFRIRCTLYEWYRRRPRANIIVNRAAAAASAADRVVKALRRDQVRDAEEEEQRQEEYTNSTSTYSRDCIAAAPAKQI